MSLTVEAFDRFEAVAGAGAALFEDNRSADFFATAAWWRSVEAAGMPAGATACFLLCRAPSGAPLAMLALQRQGSRLAALTNPYSCLFAPLLAPGLDDPDLVSIGHALGGFCRCWPVLRLDAMAQDSPGLEPLLAGLRAAGLAIRRFDHFGNWHAAIDGSWPRYLQSRPGELRETIRRRLRRMEREHARFELVRTAATLEAGIAAYADVYARSWKVAEPFPDFNPALMRHAAEAGMLRLGLLRTDDGTPIAAQFWVVASAQATLLKLAHDEAFKPLSPGTLLTALMIRALLEAESIAALDFGRGDDAYKRLWAGSRRQRIGLLLINPRRPRGLATLVRQDLGVAWARYRRSEPSHAHPA